MRCMNLQFPETYVIDRNGVVGASLLGGGLDGPDVIEYLGKCEVTTETRKNQNNPRYDGIARFRHVYHHNFAWRRRRRHYRFR